MSVALVGAAFPAAAATKLVDCTKGKDLQKEIDGAASFDIIEIKGICMTNILIQDKAVTLIGHASPGPHGITGVAANTDGVRIENSRGTRLEDLTINNPLFTGVRMRRHSQVVMEDVEISNSFAGSGTGIWVEEASLFNGIRLRLDNNLRGLGATTNSQAFCYECDLNNNVAWAATSIRYSLVSLLDSEVNGDRGINALIYAYIDIDCFSHSSSHACQLDAALIAGLANLESTVAFFDAADFSGRLTAFDRSSVQVLGARQVSNPGANQIDGESSLRVEPFSGNSRLTGHTEVSGFSHALFYDTSTVLDGSLNCSAAGDAWVDSAIDLGTPGYAITDCDHAP